MVKKQKKKKICKYCIVKRTGHEEEFDERKIYSSCYAACLNVHMKHMEAEKICEKVCKDIKAWIKAKKSVTSGQIFRKTTAVLRKHDKNAAFMYETHRDIA